MYNEPKPRKEKRELRYIVADENVSKILKLWMEKLFFSKKLERWVETFIVMVSMHSRIWNELF